jgi:hypothetical protein
MTTPARDFRIQRQPQRRIQAGGRRLRRTIRGRLRTCLDGQLEQLIEARRTWNDSRPVASDRRNTGDNYLRECVCFPEIELFHCPGPDFLNFIIGLTLLTH